MTNSTLTQPLTGEALLAFVDANKDSKTKPEMAKESGYDLTGFYHALMEARGIDTTITPNPYEGRDTKDLLLEKGLTQLNVSNDRWDGFVIQDGNGDDLEDDDLNELLLDDLWDFLVIALGNNTFDGVVNVSQQGLTFTGDVLEPTTYTDFTLHG